MTEPTKQFWKKAYERNIGKLIGICFRYTRDHQLSEDLAHDAFLKSIEKYTSFEGKGPFDAWLRRVVVNHVLQHLRDRKENRYLDDLMPYHPELDMSEESTSPDTKMIFTAAELLHIIDQLPEHHRWVFNLYVMEKYTHAQIAEELGISEGTSKSHLARGRKKLKELLAHKTEENEKYKEDNKFLLLLLSKNGDEQLSQLFENCFDQFLIPPKNPLSLDSLPFNNPVSIETLSKPFFKIATVSGIITVVTISILIIQPWKNNERNTIKDTLEKPVVTTNDSFNEIQKFKNFQPKAATISKDSVISNINLKQLPMKPLDSLALMIAISSSTLNAVTIQDSIKNQIETVQSKTDTNDSSASTEVTKKEKGTFSASTLFWSKENNEVYLTGKVKVDFEEQHFKGEGSFNFLGKVYLLVVDGQQIELGETVKLSNNNYELVLLRSKEATSKYGIKGQQGAIEISHSRE